MNSPIRNTVGLNPFFAPTSPTPTSPSPNPETEKLKKVKWANQDSKTFFGRSARKLKFEGCCDDLPPLSKPSSVANEMTNGDSNTCFGRSARKLKFEHSHDDLALPPLINKPSSVTNEVVDPDEYDVNRKEDGAHVVTLDITYEPARARHNSSKNHDPAVLQKFLAWRSTVPTICETASPKIDPSHKITKTFGVMNGTERRLSIPNKPVVLESKKFEEKFNSVYTNKCPNNDIENSTFSPVNQKMSAKKEDLEPEGKSNQDHSEERPKITIQDIAISRLKQAMPPTTKHLEPEDKSNQVNSVKHPKIAIQDLAISRLKQPMPAPKKYLKPLTKEQKNEFQDACISGSPADVLAILEIGAVLVNDALEHSWSGLQHACYLGRADNVKVLLEAGADPNFKRFDDMNALMSAACSKVGEDSDGPLMCAKLVVEAGGNLEALHAKSITPLIFAVKLGHVRMVTYFLENGTLPLLDHRDMNTRSALDWAAFLGKAKIVRVLLVHGANVLDTNRFRQTPAEVALRKGYNDISDLIRTVQTTQWRPGKDPMLREVLDMDSNLKLKEINKIRRLDMIKTFEDEHLGMILESLNLTHLAPLFKKHRISYLDFLRLKESHFAEMGIWDRSERQALCRAISETSSSIFTQDDPKTLRVRRTLTYPEIYCILIDNKQHLALLSDNLKELQRRIAEEPQTLIVGAETTSIADLIRESDSILYEVDQLLNGTYDLNKLLLQSNGKPESAIEPESTNIVETNTRVVPSNRSTWHLLVGCAAGAGLSFMVYKTFGFSVVRAFKNWSNFGESGSST